MKQFLRDLFSKSNRDREPVRLSRLLDLLYPPPAACPLCGKPWTKQRGAPVCPRCVGQIAALQAEAVACRHCGRFFSIGAVVSRSGLAGASVLQPELSNRSESRAGTLPVEAFCCADCRQNPPSFQLARAIGPFEGLLREAVYQLKYQGKQSLGEPLGRLMATVIRKERRTREPPLVVPVPLHPDRLAERGFNQAELLAAVVARELGGQLNSRLLIRPVATASQTRLNRAERLINLRGAFAVREPGGTGRPPLVLVDDVLTSGSTSEECTRVLRQAGYGPVTVITIATGKFV